MTNIYTCTQVNEAYNMFEEKLHILLDKHFPLVKVSRKKLKDEPWVTQGIRKSIKHENLLYRKYTVMNFSIVMCV